MIGQFNNDIEYDEDIYDEILFHAVIHRFNRFLSFLYTNVDAHKDEESRKDMYKNFTERLVNALDFIGDYKIFDDINEVLNDGDYYKLIEGIVRKKDN